MTLNEITRVQEYLRLTFANNRIKILQPKKPDAPIEVYLGDEFIGVLYRDDEGEKSPTRSIFRSWKRICRRLSRSKRLDLSVSISRLFRTTVDSTPTGGIRV